MMEKDNIKQFPVQRELTEEEIAARMAADEAEMERRLQHFAKHNPMPESSGVEEQEDDEEETFTLDLESGEAYQVESTIVTREVEDEEISEGLAERIKKAEEKINVLDAIVVNDEPGPEYEAYKEQERYGALIRDRFVSRAIGALIAELNRVDGESHKVFGESKLGIAIGGKLDEEFSNAIYKKKMELRAAYSGMTVKYDKIPDWAKNWIDEYIQGALNSLITLAEE